MRRRWRRLLLLLVVVACAVGGTVAAVLATSAAPDRRASTPTTTPPATGPSTTAPAAVPALPSGQLPTAPSASSCAPATQLRAIVRSQLESGRVVLPPGRCWIIHGPVTLHDLRAVTLEGNHDAIEEPTSPSAAWSPLVQVFEDTDLTIRDLTLVGSGATGGPGTEGHTAVVAEDDVGLTLEGVDILHVAGDFIGLDPPGVHEIGLHTHGGGGPNRQITVAGCTWVGAGYHGVTIEAAVDALFEHDVIADATTDAIDMEYDGGYTSAHPLHGPGWPQDDVAFNDDVFAADGQVTLNVANTGSTTVEDLSFSDNRLIHGTRAILDIAGVPGGHPVTDLTITGNTATTPTNGPDPNDTIHLSDVEQALVADNTVPYDWYVQPAGHAHLYKVAVIADRGSSGVSVRDNRFPGAATVQTGATGCGNTWAVDAWQAVTQHDRPCAS